MDPETRPASDGSKTSKSRKRPAKKAASTTPKKTAAKKATAKKTGPRKTAPRAAEAPSKPRKTAAPAAVESVGPTVTAEERRRMIAEAAYYRAQRRGFAPADTARDWLEAEAEIDARLIGGPTKD